MLENVRHNLFFQVLHIHSNPSWVATSSPVFRLYMDLQIRQLKVVLDWADLHYGSVHLLQEVVGALHIPSLCLSNALGFGF